MIPWWVAVLALSLGAAAGVFAAALLQTAVRPFDRCDDPDCDMYDNDEEGWR